MERHHPKLQPTHDHIVPVSRGGRAVIVACIQCNGIKADMLPEQWAAFMAANPGWWLLDKLALRAARRMVSTPGIQHRTQFGIYRPRARKPGPVVVPPELIYANSLRPYERAMFLLQAHRDAAAQAPAEAACAVPPADGPMDAPASVSAPAPHSGDLL